MGWMPFWALGGAVALAALIWLAVAGTQRGRAPESPEQILKRRYASGEVSREEYQQRLDDLRR